MPEDDFRELVLNVQKQKNNIKGTKDNIERGNVFMTLFFVRETLEHFLNGEQ